MVDYSTEAKHIFLSTELYVYVNSFSVL